MANFSLFKFGSGKDVASNSHSGFDKPKLKARGTCSAGPQAGRGEEDAGCQGDGRFSCALNVKSCCLGDC